MTSSPARLASVLVKARPVHHQISSYLHQLTQLSRVYRKCGGLALNLRGTLYPSVDACSRLPRNSSSWKTTSELLFTLLMSHHNHMPPVLQGQKIDNHYSTRICNNFRVCSLSSANGTHSPQHHICKLTTKKTSSYKQQSTSRAKKQTSLRCY